MREKLAISRLLKLQLSGHMMNAQYFHVVSAHAINGKVVFMNDELTRSVHPSDPPHAGEAGELFGALAQFFNKRSGSCRVILRDDGTISSISHED
jgi:hypothetical protein